MNKEVCNMQRDVNVIKNDIVNGRTALGIEFGSTRIKSVLVGEDNAPIASGSHDWENSYVDHIWTYSLDEIWSGLKDSYRNLAAEVKEKYGLTLTTVSYTHLDVYKRQLPEQSER